MCQYSNDYQIEISLDRGRVIGRTEHMHKAAWFSRMILYF